MLRNEIFEAHLFCTVTFGGPQSDLVQSNTTEQNYTLSTGAQVFQCLTSKFMSLATRTSNRLDWDTVERLIALPIELFARNAGKPCARVFNEFKSAKRSETKHTGVPEFGKFSVLSFATGSFGCNLNKPRNSSSTLTLAIACILLSKCTNTYRTRPQLSHQRLA